jgi:copper chaperone CopZ
MCPTCKTTIENNMNVVKGVQIATLNLDSNTLQVQYKTAKTNPDKLRKALTNIGYDADGLPSNPRAYNALMQCCKKEYGRHDN